jgi:hypothetical protein
VDDTLNPDTPDSVFPNNWVFFMKMEMWHYPNVCRESPSERREEILDMLEEKGFKTENIVDYTLQKKMVFLEGTGSLLLDRANEKHIALCLSS